MQSKLSVLQISVWGGGARGEGAGGCKTATVQQSSSKALKSESLELVCVKS